ncbi:MAG: excinuclease ABC subunit UvrC [Clostridia bacterium]|nr:excinuclease ABC subunit UvrC [Clostridia bacterium]
MKIRETLLAKASELAPLPGVYLMKDAEGKVIYVGKSRKLHDRVSQYFQNGEKSVKTARMVAAVRDFETICVSNEAEALTLENELIKLYLPRFNIKLKDAKAYPYIKITVGEAYPRIVYTRKREADGARYFGPFPDQTAAKSLIGTVCRVIGMPNCKLVFPRDIGSKRPCIYREMHRCVAPCTGELTPEEYRKTVEDAISFLSGNTAQVRRSLTERMQTAAEEERYEAAALFRDSIKAFDALRQRQKVLGSPDTDLDVIASETGDASAVITVFSVRGGVLLSKEDFVLRGDEAVGFEDLTSFASGYYSSREALPPLLLLESIHPDNGNDVSALETVLSRIAGHKVNVSVPVRGEKRALCLMAKQNAAEKLRVTEKREENTLFSLVRLGALLGLETVPRRLEAYDVSNYGSEQIRAAMIVSENGAFQKKDYRVFRMEDGKQDDFACMREAVFRRLSHNAREGEETMPPLPDVMLIDGGERHVAVAKAAAAEAGVSLPIFGMVKDDRHRTRALTDGTGEIGIARETEVYRLIYGIQEEVHRFAYSRTESGKRKTLRRSSLEKIEGVGRVKAKRLLAYFGGLEGVRRADRTELEESGIGVGAASAVYAYFHPEDDKER